MLFTVVMFEAEGASILLRSPPLVLSQARYVAEVLAYSRHEKPYTKHLIEIRDTEHDETVEMFVNHCFGETP